MVAGAHLYTWVKGDEVEFKEITRRARLEPQISRSGVRGVNRSANTRLHAINETATILHGISGSMHIDPRNNVKVFKMFITTTHRVL